MATAALRAAAPVLAALLLAGTAGCATSTESHTTDRTVADATSTGPVHPDSSASPGPVADGSIDGAAPWSGGSRDPNAGTEGRVHVPGPKVMHEATTKGDGYRLPGLSQHDSATSRLPLVSVPLPQTASASGRLVRGYPARAVPVAPRSRVDVTSVSPSSGVLQVSLTARSTVWPSRVALFYRLHLTRLGFHEVSSPSAAGTTGIAFQRQHDSVVVTIQPGPDPHYSVFARLSADR